ncbi:hypothetical protein DDB_G0276467 [Dictyostelium discoideum AX4]|uniref:Uncharacterized protein DDB_G0276467 n=1 Tax=Dictyostelium discoideum TaxID=44689 RepID=Y7090_DICDI|nr:hypothetical protein DDB_G0276467 [Dictyostelium discoideum AX4]Q86HV3.1 RecName: Full=Uncharacterized protein DDB_G0276467 [Dictyostelium discoideum]EAL69187.1 hypothetical protein DDB_G0276467 [Dictyostelium discoideum AX4]|eukprot:XP_643156.1 hypothetical protein DDB_G0276467 [Dictyostelium discoideum AX4]
MFLKLLISLSNKKNSSLNSISNEFNNNLNYSINNISNKNSITSVSYFTRPNFVNY